MKRLLLIVLLLAMAIVVVAGGVAAWGWYKFQSPGPLASEKIVIIPEGAGLTAIASRLTEAGILEEPYVFLFGTRVLEAGRNLRAGEYAFPAAVSPKGIVDILTRGEQVVRRLTVPEGLLSEEILLVVASADGLKGDVPEEAPPEGALLPETYHYHYGDGRGEILARMGRAMAETLAELWPGRAEGLPLDSPEEAVILASIVERETGVAGERAKVASVFINRLERGMRLQSDPTVAYALTEGKAVLERALTRQDWKIDHPYNTYVHAGLPPGPIANPGRAAIEAVLHPDHTEFLYFVADGSGGHAFAKTLAEHNRNVAKWRRIRDNQSN